MRDSVVAKRYAEAFVAFAGPIVGIPRIVEDFGALMRTMEDNPDLGVFLHSPEFAFNEKAALVDNVLKKGFSAELRQFLKLLIEKRRIDRLEDVAEYIRLQYAHGGAVNAVVKSSYPLDLDMVALLKEKLEKKFKKKFNLYLELDGALHGGMQLTIGNTVIDGSVHHRLEELREKLKATRIV